MTFRVLSALLIILLFTVGNVPAAGQQFPGTAHWVAHVSAYAVIAFTFGLGWNRIPWPYVALIVGVVGFVHELTEIVFHAHPFEALDALVNFVGGAMGAGLLGLYRRRGRR